MAKKNDPDKLTPMQELFCHKLLQCDFDQTKAAEEAGYSKKTAPQQASRLLSQVKIQSRVNELIEDKLNLKKGQLRYKVLEETANIAFDDMSIDIMYDRDGNPLGVRLTDRLKALEMLGKYGGLWNEKTKLELSGKLETQNTNANIDYSNLSDEESKNLFMDLIGKDE